jgi:hypothetical protein
MSDLGWQVDESIGIRATVFTADGRFLHSLVDLSGLNEAG